MAKQKPTGKARLLDDLWSDPIPFRSDLAESQRAEFETASREVKLFYLANHFGIEIAPRWGHSLALRLAEEFVAGFDVAEPAAPRPRGRGRPKGTGEVDQWKLYQMIGRLEAAANNAGQVFSIAETCRRLASPRKKTPVSPFQGQCPETLETAYHRAKSQIERWKREAAAVKRCSAGSHRNEPE